MHPFWSVGFRPFFAATLVMAFVLSILWTMQYTGHGLLDTGVLSFNTWHAMTMIFGFVNSAIIGFLLTATPKWTSTKPIAGNYLKIIFTLFVVGQGTLVLGPLAPVAIYKLLCMLLPTWLVLHLLFLFLRTKNHRQFVILIPLILIAVCAYAGFGSSGDIWINVCLGAIRMIVVVVAGRVIPFFSHAGLAIEVRPAKKGMESLLVLVMLLLMFEPFFQHTPGIAKIAWTILTTLAIAFNAYRVLRWPLLKAAQVPILFILYIAYGWIIIHFILNLTQAYGLTLALGQGALHALTFGAMGTMILGMINRVTLGHTGRTITASKPMFVSYTLICLGAIIRVFAPLILPKSYFLFISISGTLWAASFFIAAFVLMPMLFQKRIDQA